MSEKKYAGELFMIMTEDGEHYAPGWTIPGLEGLAVTLSLSEAGRFAITHIPTGRRAAHGNYERFDCAAVDMATMCLIAKTYGFSWTDPEVGNRVVAVSDMPVPTLNPAEIEISVLQWIRGLSPAVPGKDIDTPPWEDEHPSQVALRIINAVTGKPPAI